MKYYSNICSVCGTDTYKLRFVKVGVPKKVNYLRPKILSMWKRECTRSLCDVLFDSKCPDLFLEYFQQGMYCPDCLQIIRDVDFTWKQFMECKRRIEKQSTKVRTLLTRNYQNGDHKSEAAVIEARISGLPDSFVDDYSAKEVLEMIYSVIHSNRGTNKVGNRTMKSEQCKEFPTDVNKIKEEPTDDNYNDNFNSGDDDWHSENAADETDVKNSSSLKRAESEIKYPKEIKRPRRSVKSYAISEDDVSDTELESDEDQFDQSNDKEWKPPSNYSSFKLTGKNQPFLKQKRKQDLHKLANDETESENSEDKDANVVDNDFESKVKKTKKFKRTKFKTNLYKEKMTSRKKERGLQTDIVLDDSELVILDKICAMKIDCKPFPFRSLADSEMNLALKISQYSQSSIGRLNLAEEQEKGILKLVEKLLDRKRKQKYRRPRSLKTVKFCCTEENCSEKLNNEEELEGHIRGIHFGETLPFYCTTCPKKYSTYSNVRSHRQNIHNGIRMSLYHFCKICQKGYRTEEELKSHSETAHQGPNPFSCSFCDAECTTSLDLIRHMNESHPEVTPEMCENSLKHKCDKCGKYCRTELYFKKHMAKHEMPANENLFKCNQCKNSFSSESSLQAHIDSQHLRIVCDVCGKSVVKNGFTKHMNRHNGLLNYECKICNKLFHRGDLLSAHEKMHSGIRSFICSVCGKGFFTKIVLDGHEKIHEPGYVPRKPNRRTKSNRKKIMQQPNPEPESPGGGDSLTLAANQHSEAFLGEQNLHINNSAIAHRPSIVDYKYAIDHTSDFVYHHM